MNEPSASLSNSVENGTTYSSVDSGGVGMCNELAELMITNSISNSDDTSSSIIVFA